MFCKIALFSVMPLLWLHEFAVGKSKAPPAGRFVQVTKNCFQLQRSPLVLRHCLLSLSLIFILFFRVAPSPPFVCMHLPIVFWYGYFSHRFFLSLHSCTAIIPTARSVCICTWSCLAMSHHTSISTSWSCLHLFLVVSHVKTHTSLLLI